MSNSGNASSLSAFAGAACVGSVLALTNLPAAAEAPLYTEGAETESEGAYEVEAAVVFEEGVRGFAASVGYVPVENIEIEIEAGLGRDGDEEPSARIADGEFSIKWVPGQSGNGMAYGFMFEIGREMEDDRSGEKSYETEKSLQMLFSYDIASGPKIHVNTGVQHVAEDDESDMGIIYGLALEQRVARRFTVTAEVFGAANERASQALGLRYKFSGDTSLYAQIGRQGDESFGAIGVAFEFEPE